MKVIFEMDTDRPQDAIFMGQLAQGIQVAQAMMQAQIEAAKAKLAPPPSERPTISVPSAPATAVPDATGDASSIAETGSASSSIPADPKLAPLPESPYSDIDIKRITTEFSAKKGMAELVKEVNALGFKQVRTMTSEAKQRLAFKLDKQLTADLAAKANG